MNPHWQLPDGKDLLAEIALLRAALEGGMGPCRIEATQHTLVQVQVTMGDHG